MIHPQIAGRLLEPVRRIPQSVLALAALGTALVAQLLAQSWMGVAAYVLAAFLFIQATQSRSGPNAALVLSRSSVLSGYALAVAVTASFIVKAAQPPDAFPAWWAVLVAWVAALVAYALAWASPRTALIRPHQLWAAYRFEIMLLLGLVAATFVLRTFALDRFPRTMSGDDGQAALRAREVLQATITSPFGTSGVALGQFPTLYFFAQAGLMRLFGDDVAGSRLMAAVLGTASVAGLYLLGRAWYGRTVGFVAATIMLALPYHMYWSRSSLNNIGDALSVVVFLLLLTRAFTSARRVDFALAGLSLGLGQYAYGSVRVLLPVAALLISREVVADRRWLGRNWANLLVMAGGLVVAYLPQAVYFVDHPNAFFDRFQQVSIIHNGWLVAEAQRTDRSYLTLIAEQFRVTFLVFSHTAPKMFFEPGRPLLDPLSAVFLVLGLAYVLVTWRQRSSFALLATELTLLGGIAMTEDQPNSARLVATSPLAVLVASVGLVRTAEMIGSHRKRVGGLLIVVATTFAVIFGVHFYFFQWASGSNYDPMRGGAATELGYYMREWPPGTRFLFLADGMSCGSHESLKFIAPSWECIDVPSVGAAGRQPALRPSDVVISHPKRRAEAERLAAGRGAYTMREIEVLDYGAPVLLAYQPAAE